MTIDTVLPLILGAGGAGFLAALTQAVAAWRAGTDTREARAVANLERWRDEADQRATRLQAELDAQHRRLDTWRAWAGSLEYALNTTGVPLPPRPPDL